MDVPQIHPHVGPAHPAVTWAQENRQRKKQACNKMKKERMRTTRKRLVYHWPLRRRPRAAQSSFRSRSLLELPFPALLPPLSPPLSPLPLDRFPPPPPFSPLPGAPPPALPPEADQSSSLQHVVGYNTQ